MPDSSYVSLDCTITMTCGGRDILEVAVSLLISSVATMLPK